MGAGAPDRHGLPVPRGKVVDGSSAINGQVFLRGIPEDFESWAAMGNDQRDYLKVLPYFRKQEPDTESDDALDSWMPRNTVKTTHISGTCKLGPASDRSAVVDHYCRVHGLETSGWLTGRKRVKPAVHIEEVKAGQL